MGELLGRIRDRILNFYNGLNRNRKIILIAALAVGVLALTMGILFFTRTEYVEVATGLSPAEAQAITTKLDELGIPWRDERDTSVILVPSSDESRARMELAVDIQASNFSWNDVFSSESITMTSQTREQMYIQAKAAAVENAIETITAVDNATVILQVPKESNYFIKDDIQSKASVVLDLKSGYTLNELQVNGIVNLIVSSVKDLTAENVTVLDTTGIQLNSQESNDSFTASSQFEIQMKIEKQMQSDLTDFLEKIYGVGNVEVKPSITLDFDKQSETQTLFSPPIEGEVDGIVRSASRITENVVNGTSASGVAGTDSNTNGITTTVEGDNGGSSYEKASETLNYELNQIYREIVKAQGDVVSMSIGVLINSNALVDGEITDEHYQELLKLIAMSAGTDSNNISIMTQAFPDPMEYYDVYTGQDTAGMLFGIPIWALIAIGVVTLIIVIAAVIVLRTRRQRRDKQEEERLALEARQQEELEEIGAEAEDKGSPKYHIEKFVDTNPEAAAALLRAWLNEL